VTAVPHLAFQASLYSANVRPLSVDPACYWSPTLEQAERKLTLKTLQGQLALLKIACDGFSREFDEETSDREQQARVANKWDAALKECRALQFVLD